MFGGETPEHDADEGEIGEDFVVAERRRLFHQPAEVACCDPAFRPQDEIVEFLDDVQPKACVGHRHFPSLELARLDTHNRPHSPVLFLVLSAIGETGSLVAALGSDLEGARPAGHAKRATDSHWD